MRRARAGLWALAAAVLWALAWTAAPARLHAPDYLSEEKDLGDYLDQGEALLHRLNSPWAVSRYMPAAGLTASAVYNHSGPEGWRWWRAATATAAFWLTVYLGFLCGAPGLGLSAPVALWAAGFLSSGARPIPWHGSAPYPQPMMELLVLAAACLAADRAARPGEKRDRLLGTALGGTLLFRSSLVFYPLWLAGQERLAGLKGRRELRSWLVVGGLAAAFVLPWGGVNRLVQGRWIFLENMKADPMIVSAIAGEAGTPAVDPYRAAPGEVMSWALGEIRSAPAAYAAGCAARLWGILKTEPWLWLAALGGFLRRRRGHEVRAVAGLAAYFAVVHSLFAVEPGHLAPLRPLLAVLAAAGLGKTSGVPGSERLRDRLALAAWALPVLAGAAALAGALRYVVPGGPPAEDPAALGTAAADFPADGWLAFQRGKARLVQGDYAGAAEDLDRALWLAPGFEGRKSWITLARILAGRPTAEEAWETAVPDRGGAEDRVLAAFGWLRLGKEARARAALAEGARRLGPAGGECGACGRWLSTSRPWLEGAAPAMKLEFLGRLAAARPACDQCAERWLQEGEWSEEGGDRKAAKAALGRAQACAPGTEAARRLARAWSLLGEAGRAEKIISALAVPDRPDPDFWLDAAEAYLAAGKTEAAAEALEKAGEKIDQRRKNRRDAVARSLREAKRPPKSEARPAEKPGDYLDRALGALRGQNPERAAKALREGEAAGASPEELREYAKVYRGAGKPADSLRLLKSLESRFSGDAAFWLETAEAAAEAGAAPAALRALAFGGKLDGGAAAVHRAALVRQRLGRHAEAEALLSGLLEKSPSDPVLWSDRGVCRELLGKREEAISDLRRALELSPGASSAALSLAAVYERQGDRRSASRTLDDALARSKESDPLRGALRREADRLRRGVGER